MRAHRTIVALLFVAAAVGCSDKAPTPSPQPSSFTFTTALLPGNEVPPVTNADQTGSGSVTIVMSVTRDSAGAITAATANFSVTLTGFPAGTSLRGAHIHQAVAGVNAGIIVDTGLANGEVVLAAGAGAFTKNAINVPAITANSLAGGGAFYFNVHTQLNPGGAVRGQLAVQ